MTLGLSSIKQHAEDFITKTMTTLDSSYHTAVREFCTFLEGKQTEQQAVEFLQAKGYTVTPPNEEKASA